MAKTKTPVKSAKTAKPVEKTRLPAAEQMAKRTRVSFGAAFIRDVIAGVQRDTAKQLALAVAIGLGTAGKLKQLAPETLRERLGAKLQTMKPEDLPKNAKFEA
jgi:hypothetical protein